MSKHMRSFLALLLVSLPVGCKSGATPIACGDPIGCVEIAPGAALELGVLQSLSGSAANTGWEQVRSIELAVQERGGQLLGHPIELQIEDSQCTPEGGINAALKVCTRPQIVAILGTNCSGAARTAGKIMSEAGMVMVSGSNTASSLTSVGGERGDDWQPGYFRTIYNDVERGRTAATFVFRELGVTRAATINDGDAFTKGLTDTFEQVFVELGGEIVLSATVNKGDEDMQPVMTSVAAFEVEFVFFALFLDEATLIVRQTRAMSELENLTFMSGGSVLEPLIQAWGADGKGMYFVGPATLQGAASDELRAQYLERYGELPPGDTFGFAHDSANLVLDAIEAVALQEDDGTLHIGRQALRDALYATRDWAGVTGKLTCDEFGDCGNVHFNVYRLDDPAAGLEGVRSNVIYTTPEQ